MTFYKKKKKLESIGQFAAQQRYRTEGIYHLIWTIMIFLSNLQRVRKWKISVHSIFLLTRGTHEICWSTISGMPPQPTPPKDQLFPKNIHVSISINKGVVKYLTD